ncbi:E3 ubiquitin-protein ligase BOI-like [Silene latifolia]|uniref:E3 ubiquitin-protein ligase BOI-like n=1 Tax=Silene latifolia TaxID=37657 RepID=UPI003D78AA4F
MLGGDSNYQFLGPMDNFRVPNNPNIVPPMQFDDVLAGCNVGMMNMGGNQNASLNHLPMKPSKYAPFSPHKLPVTLNDGIGQDEGGQCRSIWNQLLVSTGLKLSYGDNEPNSSTSSTGETTMVNPSHHSNLQMKLARQSDELDQYIRMQSENIRKGIGELNHRHTTSLLHALKKDIIFRIREKDAEIENLNHKNKELIDKLRQLEVAAQSWQYKAQQNEFLVNALRTHITQVFRQGAANVSEGYDENIQDDAVSSSNLPPSVPKHEPVNCKSCKGKEVSVLMLPCRHLCLCTDCEVLIEVCPVCRVKKTGTLQVYM